MKRLGFILLMLALWCSCQDDEVIFGVEMPQQGLSFEPISGGAIMRYQLPKNDEVMGINVRYQNAFGESILCTGSYACDSLVLTGFTEARQNVPAQVTLSNRDNVESAPIDVTFNTGASGTVLFFDSCAVMPSWNGIELVYSIPESIEGMAHVLYVGEDPITQKADTLLISSFILSKGRDTLAFRLQQERESYDVVVRTEDYKGHRVMQKVWEGINVYQSENYPLTVDNLSDPSNLSIEDDDAKLGLSYLVDGDCKGEKSFKQNSDVFYTYVAGPKVLNKPLVVVDLGAEKEVAEMRLHSMLHVRFNFPDWRAGGYGNIWYARYENKLPCAASVYGTNTPDNPDSWVLLSDFEQDLREPLELRWCNRCPVFNGSYAIANLDELAKAEPLYVSMYFPTSGEKYRYLKLEINELFELTTSGQSNFQDYVTLNEIEVYVKSE